MRTPDVYIVLTSNLIDTINADERAMLVALAIQRIDPKGPDFIVFDPDADTKKTEDGGRTLRIPVKTIPGKVYAKLDDYGSKETLSENVGHKVNTQYVLTLMMSSDY